MTAFTETNIENLARDIARSALLIAQMEPGNRYRHEAAYRLETDAQLLHRWIEQDQAEPDEGDVPAEVLEAIADFFDRDAEVRPEESEPHLGPGWGARSGSPLVPRDG